MWIWRYRLGLGFRRVLLIFSDQIISHLPTARATPRQKSWAWLMSLMSFQRFKWCPADMRYMRFYLDEIIIGGRLKLQTLWVSAIGKDEYGYRWNDSRFWARDSECTKTSEKLEAEARKRNWQLFGQSTSERHSQSFGWVDLIRLQSIILRVQISQGIRRNATTDSESEQML